MGTRISKEELRDKISGIELGNCPATTLVFLLKTCIMKNQFSSIDRHFNYKDAKEQEIKMNINDQRAFVKIMADAMGGA